ncbi:hypothetical protein QP903_09865 [Corynebacterium pseudodiphtheriticum]|nr:hypothetical protein [Corynebacterium pseudodiphtheriticum]MDK8546602.1 hypothetical protein [Corynebacterium pseudodiphtheriticum]
MSFPKMLNNNRTKIFMLDEKNYILVTPENQESHKSARTRRGAELPDKGK